MSFPQSPEYQLEDAISDLFDSSALNVYKTNRTGAREFPYLLISARTIRQLINPYSGVYEIDVTMTYADSSAKTTSTQFDEKYLDIFGALYSPAATLTEKISQNTIDLKIYSARISEQIPTILQNKRAWVRGLRVTAIVTPEELADGYRAYIFSEFLNSFYLATI